MKKYNFKLEVESNTLNLVLDAYELQTKSDK